MNRKFSTLLTAGLLVAGSVFSSAYADKLPVGTLATKVESGVKYFIIQSDDREEPDDNDDVLGMTEDIDHATVFYKTMDKNAEIRNGETLQNYLWTVSEDRAEGSGNYKYTFTNVATGKKLLVKKDGTGLETATSGDNFDAAYKNFSWDGFKKYDGAVSANRLWVSYLSETADPSDDVALQFNNGTVSLAATGIYGINLFKAEDQAATVDELNQLYNTAGFNFKFTTDSYNGTIDNAFNVEGQALKAIQVEEALTVKTVAGVNYGFPKGTYFVTETPRYAFPYIITAVDDDATQTAKKEAQKDYLLNSTFIAVSSSENVSTKADIQKEGEGFVLTTVAGKDLNLMPAGLKASQLAALSKDEKPCGTTINVNNAVFTVMKKAVADGTYALKLNNMFYSYADAAATDIQTSKAVYLAVKSDASYSSSRALVTVKGSDNNYIFKFVESNVVKGTEFISAEGKSIYNIQVGEYFLNNTMDNTTAKFYATGSALADLDAPAYQFVVTKVNGNEVTFTNRAYQNNSITVKLFDVGNGWYSLAPAAVTTATFTCLDIQNNGDVKENAIWKNVSFKQLTVKLIPAEAEEISGLDVEDGTQVTIAFARDFTPTSNKMYPVVHKNDYGIVDGFEGKLTDEVAEAAQWQLVKDPSGPTYKTLTYAYLDADDKVAYKTWGDTVAYYTYKLQLVEDGNPVADKYLSYTSTYGLDAKDSDNTLNVKIKENVDGSVVISQDGKYFFSVDKNSEIRPTINAELVRELKSNKLCATYNANDIKTYLVQDAPEVSLPATAKYVTLQSELGNYISMNEEGDAIIVSNEPLTYRVFATDLNNVVPSFFISTDYEEGARLFLFNPEDSVNYYVGAGQYDKDYQWKEDIKKAIFKAGILNETADTLVTDIKGDLVEVANKANNKGVKGGLNRFKFQIVLAPGEDDLYLIRQLKANDLEMDAYTNDKDIEMNYLTVLNGRVVWGPKETAEMFAIAETTSPTANEAVAAAEVSVVAVNGAIIVKGAAGKVVTVANILGQTIANQVAASDNVTIAAPAGIAVVTVDGEATKVVVK